MSESLVAPATTTTTTTATTRESQSNMRQPQQDEQQQQQQQQEEQQEEQQPHFCGFEHELHHFYYQQQQDRRGEHDDGDHERQDPEYQKQQEQQEQEQRQHGSSILLSQLDWMQGQLLILQEEDSAGHFRMLFVCLMLTSTLAVFSAHDAKHHCQLQEGDWSMLFRVNSEDVEAMVETEAESYLRYYGEDTDDDEYATQTTIVAARTTMSMVKSIMSSTCNQMFYHVLLPVGLVTVLLSSYCLILLNRQQQHQQVTEALAAASNESSTSANTNVSISTDEVYGVLNVSSSSNSGLAIIRADRYYMKNFECRTNVGGIDSVCNFLHPTYPYCRRTNNLLLMLALCILGLWTYGIEAVMLRPTKPVKEDGSSDDSSYDDQTNNEEDIDSSEEKYENPYISLAAVDAHGLVGPNANLYYLSWISEAIALALVYQLCLVCYRQYQRPTTATISPSPSKAPSSANHGQHQNENENNYDNPYQNEDDDEHHYLPEQKSQNQTTAVQSAPNAADTRMASAASFWVEEKHLSSILQYHHQEQHPHLQYLHSQHSKWFQTLYRLRVRTGFWVAALLSSLVLLASSTHSWNKTVMPAAELAQQRQQEQQLQETDDADAAAATADDFVDDYLNPTHLHKVCLVIYHDEYSSLPEQLCARTSFALISGFLAAALCSLAIILHVVARRRGAKNAVVALQQTATTAAPSAAQAQQAPTIQTKDQQQRHQSPYLRHGMMERDTTSSNSLLNDASSPVSPYYQLDDEASQTSSLHSRDHFYVLPLQSELFLSVVLSLKLGFNAVFVSGVQGPAATVGNLYYSSWITFLLCLRICLGCVEETYNVHHHDEQDVSTKKSSSSNNIEDKETDSTAASTAKTSGQEASNDVEKKQDSMEADRSQRLRFHFFLSVFSTVCAASAYDVYCNQDDELNVPQRYVILAPTVIAISSAILFLLCLSREYYKVLVSQVWFGGILSIIFFHMWVVDLVITMHSENSWAVNGVGEIEMANLYYFSWASTLTAGIHMGKYMKGYVKEKYQVRHQKNENNNKNNDNPLDDTMSVVWAAIVKVCFVILGAALHVWHTISDNCSFVEIQTYATLTFCSRTIFALIVAITGMVVGMGVLLIRLIVQYSQSAASSSSGASSRSSSRFKQMQAHIEAVVSIFMVLLFGAAVALITSIGGPGQSVGDLYYSTWLSFWVSLGVFISCYHQIQLEDLQAQQKEQQMLQEEREKQLSRLLQQQQEIQQMEQQQRQQQKEQLEQQQEQRRQQERQQQEQQQQQQQQQQKELEYLQQQQQLEILQLQQHHQIELLRQQHQQQLEQLQRQHQQQQNLQYQHQPKQPHQRELQQEQHQQTQSKQQQEQQQSQSQQQHHQHQETEKDNKEEVMLQDIDNKYLSHSNFYYSLDRKNEIAATSTGGAGKDTLGRNGSRKNNPVAVNDGTEISSGGENTRVDLGICISSGGAKAKTRIDAMPPAATPGGDNADGVLV